MRKRLFSVGYMFVLTLLFTSAVSAVKALNEERIRSNEAGKLQEVVLDALNISVPGGLPRRDAVARTFQGRVKKIEVKGRSVYAGYDETGERVIGYAFDAGGPGFWGPIEAMAAVDDGAQRILGVNFFRHSETPGLGARITEEPFRNQFRGLSLARDDEGEPFFRLVTAGMAEGEKELDAVTGATETSRAVEGFLNRELEIFLRDVAAHLPERS
jgi:Na+-transporting NADH:ubiquinone oxidoreductase subunit C